MTTPSSAGTPDHVARNDLLPEASMFSSRQQAIFSQSLRGRLSTNEAQVQPITNIRVGQLTHLNDTVNDSHKPLPQTLNEFQRIRYQISNRQRLQQQRLQQDIAERRAAHRHATQTVANTNPDSANGDACDDITSRTMFRPSYNRFVDPNEIVLVDDLRSTASSNSAIALHVAGPREYIAWRPGEVKACIVTCGGLCPGLNNVIQELFYCLHYNYGVDVIYGIRSGYRGFWQPQYQPWLRLTPELVQNINEVGGSILGSSRGGFDAARMVNALEVYGVNQVYVIGGDGTHRGAWALHHEAMRRGLKLSVACVPKTIDNDIGTIDRSFGFNTAMAAARNAILNAAVNAQSSTNSVAVVKLMGRHAGYIAASATISARNVDACLIPEVYMDLYGSGGLLRHIQRLTEQRGNSLIVVAEGAGTQWMEQTPLDVVYDSVPATENDKNDDIEVKRAMERLRTANDAEKHHVAAAQYDASGNKKLSDVGTFLCEAIRSSVRVRGKPVNVIYSDPSYTIRSVPADAEDAILCLFLAANAVHGAMAGYTGFSVATVNNRNVMIPIEIIVESSPAYMNPRGITWQTVLNMTHQPHVISTQDFQVVDSPVASTPPEENQQQQQERTSHSDSAANDASSLSHILATKTVANGDNASAKL